MNTAPIQLLFDVTLAKFRALWSFNLVLQVLGAGFGLLGQWFINYQNPVGFVFWLISNAALVWLQLRARFFVLVGLHVVYFSMCLHGLWIWMQR